MAWWRCFRPWCRVRCGQFRVHGRSDAQLLCGARRAFRRCTARRALRRRRSRVRPALPVAGRVHGARELGVEGSERVLLRPEGGRAKVGQRGPLLPRGAEQDPPAFYLDHDQRPAPPHAGPSEDADFGRHFHRAAVDVLVPPPEDSCGADEGERPHGDRNRVDQGRAHDLPLLGFAGLPGVVRVSWVVWVADVVWVAWGVWGRSSERTRTATCPRTSTSSPCATVTALATISTGCPALRSSGITLPGASAATSSGGRSVWPASTTMWNRSVGAGMYGSTARSAFSSSGVSMRDTATAPPLPRRVATSRGADDGANECEVSAIPDFLDDRHSVVLVPAASVAPH